MTLIKDLTFEDLETMIDEAIERKLAALLGTPDTRTLDEIFESIDQHRWTPPRLKVNIRIAARRSGLPINSQFTVDQAQTRSTIAQGVIIKPITDFTS